MVEGFPHAGKIAEVIFALGIIGLGLLAVPIFAGSASYALAETFGWREGLYLKLKDAPEFYGVMIAATLTGMAVNLIGINPMKALIYTAVINGVVAVPLILVVLSISNNRRAMRGHTNGFWTNLIGWFALAVMGLAAIVMFAAWGKRS